MRRDAATTKAGWNGVQVSLLAWYRANGRAGLPWRETRDPYRVLVSELMLQQTQVPRVVPKYSAFIRSFPDIRALARADRADVLRHWQGLGYNNRAVRLHALAKLVVEEHDGKLPRTYDGLRRLPGIGPYTAGAIMGFAYDLPAPCVDVNIQRVLARIGWSPSHRVAPDDIAALALRLVQESASPHDWHSALMDFGSAVCTARTPACGSCPLRGACKSRGPRDDETDASRPQARFAGSVRWHRGQVLKALLAKGRVGVRELQAINSTGHAETGDARARLDAALAAMEREGMITVKNGIVRLR